MKVDDTFFAGRVGWAEQILYSICILERGNREYVHPKLINKETVDSSISWSVSNAAVLSIIDLYTIPQLLVDKPTAAKRVRALTPTRAIDIGIDRDLVVPFTGIPVQANLMVENDIDTLEERLSYLLHAKTIHDQLVAEWNLFAQLQQNSWLFIYLDEALVTSDYSPTSVGSQAEFTRIADFPGFYVDTIHPGQNRWLRGITRANYDEKITQWLLDAGITTRSGGAAVSNDTYIIWMASQLSRVDVRGSLVAELNIDPRTIYRYSPVVAAPGASGSSEGGGSSGVPGINVADPALDSKPDLLEQLANNEQPLTAALGDGASNTPINTLPDC